MSNSCHLSPGSKEHGSAFIYLEIYVYSVFKYIYVFINDIYIYIMHIHYNKNVGHVPERKQGNEPGYMRYVRVWREERERRNN